MKPAITLDELLTWNDESSKFWRTYLDANPALLELPCGIGGAANVLEFAAHIWGVELRWAQRLASLPLLKMEDVPAGSLVAVYDLHLRAVQLFRSLLDNPAVDWETMMTLDLDFLPPDARAFSWRKIAAHTLFHSQRHWAQLATLVRAAGFPSGFKGDVLLSSALP